MLRRYCAPVLLCGLCLGCGGGKNSAPVGNATAPDGRQPTAEFQLAGGAQPVAAHSLLAARGGSQAGAAATPLLPGAGPADRSPADAGAADLEFNTEAYDHVTHNPFLEVGRNPLSTFSVDVDTASYSLVRRFLSHGQLPPRGAVRIEELVNYFPYDDPLPQKDVPFSANIEVAACPWNPAHRLARVGLRGREIPAAERPVSNLVFLIDVSGSMQTPNKLPLVQEGLRLLVRQLGENDRVAMVVYAGASGLVLPSTTGDQQQAILSAIDHLQAGGSTNGGAGIELAYRTAVENFIPQGTNRVILCSDGDFNVGVTSQSELVSLVEQRAQSGVFITVLGFGMGNLKDSTLEKLADRGNGNYGYIDSLSEARKLLVEQLQGTLITIAKDVKIQVEFNPLRVGAYRLIGYENRLLAAEDFHDDRKDAGEIGAGHTVTALYELVPPGAAVALHDGERPAGDPLRYQQPGQATAAADSDELFTLKLRYKEPAGDASRLLEYPAIDRGVATAQASADFTWGAVVAAFGMILRDSPHRGNATLPAVLELAETAVGEDRHGYRREFVQLVRGALPLVASRPTGGFERTVEQARAR